MTTSNSPFSMAAMLMATSAWQRVSKELYRMKKVLICGLLAIAVACCGTALYAQDNMGQGQTGQGQGQMGQGRWALAAAIAGRCHPISACST